MNHKSVCLRLSCHLAALASKSTNQAVRAQYSAYGAAMLLGAMLPGDPGVLRSHADELSVHADELAAAGARKGAAHLRMAAHALRTLAARCA
jgi:hypothetical protein